MMLKENILFFLWMQEEKNLNLMFLVKKMISLMHKSNQVLLDSLWRLVFVLHSTGYFLHDNFNFFLLCWFLYLSIHKSLDFLLSSKSYLTRTHTVTKQLSQMWSSSSIIAPQTALTVGPQPKEAPMLPNLWCSPQPLSLLAHYIQLWLHISGIYVGEEGETAN